MQEHEPGVRAPDADERPARAALRDDVLPELWSSTPGRGGVQWQAGRILQETGQILEGSFSAVSTPTFAPKEFLRSEEEQQVFLFDGFARSMVVES